MDWSAASGFLERFGFAVAGFIVFTISIVSRRKGASSFLVPGWVHDNLIEEFESYRSKAITDVLQAKVECERQVGYYRDLYETERTRFLEVNALRQKDSAMIEELLREKVERLKRKPNAPA